MADGTREQVQHLDREMEKRELWKKLQEEMKTQLVEEDGEEVCNWRDGEDAFGKLRYVAGVDISFDKENLSDACAMLVVLSFPNLEVVHVCSGVVKMVEPYIPGYLAFREVEFLMDRLGEVKDKWPHLIPQVILVDGNGILHPRGFGLASHLGVLSGIPCIGVGKKLFLVDGLEGGPNHKARISKELMKKGDHFHLEGESGRVWGAALLTSNDASNPVYVSIGHKISLETAIRLTMACSLKRVPEPIRQADIKSREVMRDLKT